MGGKELLHHGSVFFFWSNQDHKICRLGGGNGERLPKSAIGELEVEAAFAWKDDPQSLLPLCSRDGRRGVFFVQKVCCL